MFISSVLIFEFYFKLSLSYEETFSFLNFKAVITDL